MGKQIRQIETRDSHGTFREQHNWALKAGGLSARTGTIPNTTNLLHSFQWNETRNIPRLCPFVRKTPMILTKRRQLLLKPGTNFKRPRPRPTPKLRHRDDSYQFIPLLAGSQSERERERESGRERLLFGPPPRNRTFSNKMNISFKEGEQHSFSFSGWMLLCVALCLFVGHRVL